MKVRLHDLELYLHHETHPGERDQGAIRVSDDGDNKKAVWLPKSAIEFTRRAGGTVIVTATERLLTEKGLV